MTIAIREALSWDRYFGITCERYGIAAHDEAIHDSDYFWVWGRMVAEGGLEWYRAHVPPNDYREGEDDSARADYIIRIGVWASSLIDGDGDAD